MKTTQEPALPTRRTFLETGARVAAVATAGPLPAAVPAPAAELAAARPSIGIQVGAVSFVDECTEQVLDVCRSAGPSTRST